MHRPKHNEFPHVQPFTEARIARQGYPYLNRLPIFMTQARAPTPHEVALYPQQKGSCFKDLRLRLLQLLHILIHK